MRVFTLFRWSSRRRFERRSSGRPARAGRDVWLYYSASGQRIESMVLWDDQPGIVTRAYWEQPWRNRHYFPATGHKPRSGMKSCTRVASLLFRPSRFIAGGPMPSRAPSHCRFPRGR
jgi:hypothetical protein